MKEKEEKSFPVNEAEEKAWPWIRAWIRKRKRYRLDWKDLSIHHLSTSLSLYLSSIYSCMTSSLYLILYVCVCIPKVDILLCNHTVTDFKKFNTEKINWAC